MPTPVEYRVSLAGRTRHLYDVECRFPASAARRGALDVHLPVWTPGSYLIREFQRHLQDLVATDGAGRPLPVEKTDKSTWRVSVDAAAAADAAAEVRVRYQVYAHELTVRTSHLDDTHAFWNGASLFLYTDALRALPVRVRIADLPEGWWISTGLDPDPTEPLCFTALDYDALVDCPVEIGLHERLRFEVDGKPHEIAIWGKTELDRERFVSDVKSIVRQQADLFGGLPYDHYTFILLLSGSGQGGLEHRNSTTLIASPFAHFQKAKYLDLLELVSHEFFHLWNVKRIHPAVLGPFDYQREAHTRSLWVVEGWTSYYDRLFLRRAGLMSAERYLEKLGEELGRLAGIAGRKHHSLEEASWDAWIKFYRPDENTANTTVSYYLKGSLVALLLDLELRRRTGGRRTLDDVMRALWDEYGAHGLGPAAKGYTDGAVQQLVERVGGASFDDFFARSVRGKGELDLETPLAHVGLTARAPEESDDEKASAWLGVQFGSDGMRLTEVLEGGPAAAAGLSPGDRLIAWNGWRLDEEHFKAFLKAAHPGTQVKLTLFRRDRLREIAVELAKRPPHKVEIVALDETNDEQRQAYFVWMGETWPPGDDDDE